MTPTQLGLLDYHYACKAKRWYGPSSKGKGRWCQILMTQQYIDFFAVQITRSICQ